MRSHTIMIVGRTAISYQKLINQASKSWEVYVLDYNQLMPKGDINDSELIYVGTRWEGE